jgi:hypothetical protein
MKNTQKHTEEPWGLDGNGFIRLSEQLDECREEIGTENEWVPIVTLDEDGTSGVVALTHPTNAHLIASAPDLLAALRELCADKYLSDPINADRMKNARAAIAKAEGNA